MNRILRPKLETHDDHPNRSVDTTESSIEHVLNWAHLHAMEGKREAVYSVTCWEPWQSDVHTSMTSTHRLFTPASSIFLRSSSVSSPPHRPGPPQKDALYIPQVTMSLGALWRVCASRWISTWKVRQLHLQCSGHSRSLDNTRSLSHLRIKPACSCNPTSTTIRDNHSFKLFSLRLSALSLLFSPPSSVWRLFPIILALC